MATKLPDLADHPYFVPEFKAQLSGVDFLNLRQVNLNFMAECFPGTNNATKQVRGYSLICWIYWQYLKKAEKAGLTEIQSDHMIRYREKVESFYIWSHQLNELSGLPGITSPAPEPDDNDHIPLTFEAWNRSRENTSLEAAVQYGPSLTDIGGLGFLSRDDIGIYHCTPAGVKLAEALDEYLRHSEAYDALCDIDSLHGTEAHAKALFPWWRFDECSPNEQQAFAARLWAKDKINHATSVGRRSAMIALVLECLRSADSPLTEGELRQRMALPGLWNSASLTEGMLIQSRKWLLLQLRQLQRMSSESIMAWVEQKLISQSGPCLPDSLVDKAVDLLQEHLDIPATATVAEALENISPSINDLATYETMVVSDPDWYSPWNLIQQLEAAVKRKDSECLTTSVYSLLLLQRLKPYLESDPQTVDYLDNGSTPRQSLAYWFRLLDQLRDRPLKDLVDWVIKTMTISQHFSTGTRRYDGKKIRLRLILEEEGLETLVTSPWKPAPTPDRLASALSLLSGCGLIKEDHGSYSA